MSDKLAGFPRRPHWEGELCWIIVSQSLFSAVEVLDPEMVRSKEIGIYPHQAYWSLKNQKANDWAKWKVNYDLNMDSERRKLNGTGDASATQCKWASLISHTAFLLGNQRPNPVFPCLRQYWINRGLGE